MAVKEIVSILLERGMAMQTFWGFYITVALGLIAFFGSSQRTRRVAFILSVAFIAFAWVNCAGMTSISRQRWFLYDILCQASTTETDSIEARVGQGMIQYAKPDPPETVKAFHVATDIALLVTIWTLTLWQKANQGTADTEDLDRTNTIG